MDILLTGEAWMALLTLTLLEIVLGIDNIIFISIVSGRLPHNQQNKARLSGLSLALLMRIAMLFGITWIIGFTAPLFSILHWDFSARDIILALGGLFLIAKSTSEIHHKIEGEEQQEVKKAAASLFSVIIQIMLLDIIFSLDSILTAVGMTDHLLLMIIAVIISMIIMMAFSGKVADFINKHPTLQILALAFLILIGFMLMLESFGMHVPKGYIYFAVFFSLVVEILNMRFRKRRQADLVEE